MMKRVFSISISPFQGFFLGLFIYELSNLALNLYTIPVLYPLLHLIGSVICLYFVFRFKQQGINKSIYPVYVLLLLWIIGMILRGGMIGNVIPGSSLSVSSFIKHFFVEPYGEITFLIPLLGIIEFDLKNLYFIQKFAIFVCIFSLVIVLLNLDQLLLAQLNSGRTELFDATGDVLTVRDFVGAAFPCFGIVIFALFSYNYLFGKLSIIIPILVLVSLMLQIIGGGRAGTVLFSMYLLLFGLLILKFPLKFCHKNSKTLFFIKKIIIISIFLALVWLIIYLYNNSTFFDYILKRAFGGRELSGSLINDDRDILMADFIKDFNSNPLDWLWGRGVNGSYITTLLSENGRRAWMEYGYLYLILKGGCVYLFLTLLCFIHAAYVGFFRSKNQFSKVLAIICSLYFVELISTGSEPCISISYVLFWFSFGLVERKSIRELDDYTIYCYFNKTR